MLLTKVRKSASGTGETRDGGREAGTERRTMDEEESKGLEVEMEATSASQDVNDVFRIGGVDAGTGASVGVGAGMDAVDWISLMSDSAHGTTISCCVLPSRE